MLKTFDPSFVLQSHNGIVSQARGRRQARPPGQKCVKQAVFRQSREAPICLSFWRLGLRF